MTDLKSLITNLRKLASAATPGPWGYCYDGSSDFSVGKKDDPQGERVCGVYDKSKSGADAQFIAACDPQTVLRLCDKLEEAIALADFYDSMSTWVDVKNLMAQTNADPGVEAHDVFGEKAREFLKSLTSQ